MRRRTRFLLLLATVAGLVAWGWVERQWIVAVAYRLTLESSPRVEELQVDRVVQALDIAPGARVADLGAGTGLFTRRFSALVGEAGVAYAVDVNDDLLAHIARQAAALGLDNVVTIAGTHDDARLPEPVDLVFICDTLHHIENRGSYLRHLRRYVRSGGRIAIIDPPENAPHIDAVVVPSMRYTMSEFETWMHDAGFELIETHDFPEGYFFVVYQCSTCPEP